MDNKGYTVLCGHTGSVNRGCEAIIRSTADLLNQNKIDVDIATYSKEDDLAVGLDQLGNLLEYRGYTSQYSVHRLYNGIMKRVFHNEYPYEKYCQSQIFRQVRRAQSAVVVGGDTYCYGRTACIPAFELNRFVKKIHGKSFLWSCSIEKEKITPEMKQDLKRYTMIFPRESITYQTMKDIGISEEKLCLMSDSAFVLKKQRVKLPENFKNVFAYNPSFTLGENENDKILLKARIALLNHIIETTDMTIALIPHVFKEKFGDLKTCHEIAKELVDPSRVFLFDKEYNCEQLKYIISKCRFLIAERTHASIAGYSTGIPTFVVGYSVKSRGIALDLFGTTDNFVISYAEITDEDILIEQVEKFIKLEDAAKKRLKEIMPLYIERAVEAAKLLACNLRG